VAEKTSNDPMLQRHPTPSPMMQWWCFAQILLLLNKADYQASHQTIKVSTKRWISKRLVCLTAPPGNRTTAPGHLQTGCGAESTKAATISF